MDLIIRASSFQISHDLTDCLSVVVTDDYYISIFVLRLLDFVSIEMVCKCLVVAILVLGYTKRNYSV